jgi:hypothetical protein
MRYEDALDGRHERREPVAEAVQQTPEEHNATGAEPIAQLAAQTSCGTKSHSWHLRKICKDKI